MKTAACVLIIEDNQVNLELMTYLLNAFGYSTLSARDGEEGLQVALRELPDLIVCDVQMPKVDGYEVAQLAKSNSALHGIPLVAVTASAMVGDRDRVLTAGFDGYLAKPIDPASFVQHLETFLPAELRVAARATSTETSLSPARSRPGGRTILIVDDLQDNLDLASSIFEYAGYTVISAKDATHALALAKQAPPDLIMSDVCMPAGSGYDFISAVKTDPRLRHIPFVFVTSTATTERERVKGLALGAAKYLFRPLEPQVLLSEVESCLQEEKGS
jgi:two-component system, cell cycle response regulator